MRTPHAGASWIRPAASRSAGRIATEEVAELVAPASAEDDTVAWYYNGGGTPTNWTRRVITASADQAIAVYAADLDGDADAFCR